MRCEEYQDLVAGVIEENLPTPEQDAAEQHLAACAACRTATDAFRSLHGRLIGAADLDRNAGASTAGNCSDRVMDRISHTNHNWRKIMWKSFEWGGGIAAALLLAALLILWGPGRTQARADEVLTDGARAMGEVQNLHIKARVRTLPNDNFELIGLNYDFVPVEMWKQSNTRELRWQLQKPGRVMLMDGETTWLWIKPAAALKLPGAFGNVGPFEPLLNLDTVVDHEKKLAKAQGSTMTLSQETLDGRDISVVTIEAKAQGNFANDWCKDKSITQSDNRRVYRFDAETKRLEGMQIWVHPAGGNDVLVFETTQIDYPQTLPDNTFEIDLPQGVTWQDGAQLSRATAKTAKVPAAVAKDKTADEVARGFFDALARGDDRALQDFLMVHGVLNDLTAKIRSGKLTIKVISIGKPFKSGLYGGCFVPYELQISDGKHTENHKMNLAVRNDNPAKRWSIDGGF